MNRVCPVCHAEYLPRVETCTNCGVAVVDAGDPSDPLGLPEELQVVYELQMWPVDLQALAAERMAESEIPHAWNGPELVVHVEHEAAVDGVLEAIEAEHGPIVPTPVHLGDDPDVEQTEYDLTEWPEADRARLGSMLAEGAIAHRWEDGVLVVREEDEAVVEPMLDAVEYPDQLPAEDDVALDGDGDGDGATAEQLSELFLAADRLRANGADPHGITGLVAVVEQADPDKPPYGVDKRTWAGFVEDADEIADLLVDEELADGARAEAVEERADALRERLRPFV
jgi:hypothetical protein